MPFNFQEMPDSRSGDDDSQTRKYFAVGTSNEVFVQNYARSVVPSAIVTGRGTLWRQPFQYAWQGPRCEVTVPYAKQNRETGSFSWNFDTTGSTVTIKASKGTRSYPAGVQGHGGAIGVTKDGVEGTEVVIPAMKFNVTFRHPQGIITLERAFALGDYTGYSNSDTFFTRPPGSFLFLGATGADGSEADAEVTYQLAYSKNLQNAVIGGIANVRKDGWEYAWIEFDDAVDADRGVKQPQAVHVEKVYESTALSLLLGFG